MKGKGQLGPWSVVKSHYVVKDSWITVRADECETENGALISPYYVLEYPDWVNVVALNDRDEILVIHQYRHGIGKVTTEIPGGAVETTDVSPQAAAERELLEETGCCARHISLVGAISPNAASHTNQVHCFLATETKHLSPPQDRAEEEIAFEFVDIGTLMTFIDNGSFSQSMQIASIFLSLRRIGMLSKIP